MGLDLYILWAVALAALVPLSLIATRHELRKVRFRLVEELRTNLFAGANLPQLELASARYRSGSDAVGATRQESVRIWTGAFIFWLLGFAGFCVLLVPRRTLLSAVPDFPSITYALLWSTADAQSTEPLARAATVLGVAFLGGYVFQIRYLIRATLNQELGALSFVRATLSMLQGMIVALVVFRSEDVVTGGAADGRGFAVALALAFLLGFAPQIGLNKLASIAGVKRKGSDEEALAAAKIVPLEVVDGIDQETAFRLEESNLFDVQNLAAINPIALYAETPFTFHEVFDWVIQAQLCLNVGTRAFATLRDHHIRTIFDLERAVLAAGAPAGYVQAVGAILFADGSPAFRRRVGLPPAAEDATGATTEISVEIVRHAVAIICDDLHIHRLRSLWRIMLKSTASDGRTSLWLFPTGPIPGEDDFPAPPLAAAAQSSIDLTVARARELAALQAGAATADAIAAKKTECLAAAKDAIAADPRAREFLRRLWSPLYLRKASDERVLEPLYGDPDFRALLDPLAPDPPHPAS